MSELVAGGRRITNAMTVALGKDNSPRPSWVPIQILENLGTIGGWLARRRRARTRVGHAAMGDRALGNRFARGDADAIRDLYAEFGRPLFAAAYRMLGDRELAEEAVQQAFLQAWRASDRFDADRDIAPWLFSIVRRTAIDVHRRERRHSTEGLAGVEVTEDGRIESAWRVLEVRRALESMPADERAVLAATHFEGLTHEEAAIKLGIPVGTVKSRSYRAYTRLRAMLTDDTEAEA